MSISPFFFLQTVNHGNYSLSCTEWIKDRLYNKDFVSDKKI